MRSFLVLVALVAAGSQVIVRRVPPTLLSLSPSSGAVAASVVIAGRDFGTAQENTTVLVNGVLATATAWSDTSATITIPPTTTGNVTMTRGGLTSNALSFTVTSSGSQSRFVTGCTNLPDLVQANFIAAANAAADGACLVLPSGSATWSSTYSFSATKALTVAGQYAVSGSGGTTTITCTSSACFGNALGGSTKDHRVTGINFPPFAFTIWWTCPGGSGCAGTLTRNRFDYNTIAASPGTIAFLGGENTQQQHVWGLIDHNTYTSTGSAWLFESVFASADTSLGPIGTVNALYFEDNTMVIATMDNPGNGCIDLQGNASPIIWRHNTVTNCLLTSHGTTHSGGPAAFVVSDSSFIANAGTDINYRDGTRAFHHQGSGEIIAYNNVFTAIGKTGNAISVIDYCAYTNCIDATGTIICDGLRVQHPDGNTAPTATNRGYPCWHQPARDFSASPVGGVLKPMYAWNNRWTDAPTTKLDLIVETGANPGIDYTLNHLQANRDYFNAVSANAQTSATSPFNGTTGMGFGTLANRPTTCTTGAESGGGVGYYGTDTDILYRCSATNTWTTQYNFGAVPYPYPWP